MKAEQKLLKLFEDLEEAGASLTLTFSTRESKTTAKLHLETFSSSPPPTSTALSSLPPSPGKQRRHCGARARAVCNQRAAAHQASLAEAATSALVSPSPRPPCLHPSPPPASGRRIVTTLARVDVPTFSTLNVDDASSPTPPPPTLPCCDHLSASPTVLKITTAPIAEGVLSFASSTMVTLVTQTTRKRTPETFAQYVSCKRVSDI